MNKIKSSLTSIILIITSFALSAQTIDNLTFGSESTLEVVTWNIEWFPKNGQATIDYVTQIIEALDVDVLALQEINDTSAFKQLVDNLEGYEGYFKSSYYGELELAYIYKTEAIRINDIYEIYTSYPYWSTFPRSPMVMEMSYKEENYIIINNHFKCCGDGILELNDSGDEETRRFDASNYLKEYIDFNFPNDNVIMLGDLNDVLIDYQSNNVFQAFFDDASNYYFADTYIALGEPSGWSYPTWPSHIDHILITNELFDNYDTDDIQTIRIEDYIGGWGTYDANVSDHRPLAIKIRPNLISGIDALNTAALNFSIYPNPSTGMTNMFFSTVPENTQVEIYNLNGQKVRDIQIFIGESSVIWDAEGFPDGIYFAKFISKGNTIAVRKIALSR